MDEFPRGIIAKHDIRCRKTVRIIVNKEKIKVLSLLMGFQYLNKKIEELTNITAIPMTTYKKINIKRNKYPRIDEISTGYHSFIDKSKNLDYIENNFGYFTYNGERKLEIIINMEFFIPKKTRFFVNIETAQYISEQIKTSFTFCNFVRINNNNYYSLEQLAQNINNLEL